jgi:hypothetical protein
MEDAVDGRAHPPLARPEMFRANDIDIDWKAEGICAQGLFLHRTGRAWKAVQKLNSGIAA